MGDQRRHGDLCRLANDQWMVLGVHQIRSLGFTKREVGLLVERAQLFPRHRGVYYYATTRPPWKGVLLAAQWSVGPDAYLTGRTALGLVKVCPVNLRRIVVAVPRRTVRGRKPPIHLVRSAQSPIGLKRDGPLRFTSVAQAVVDLAAEGANVRELRQIITEAIHLRRFDHGHMRRLMDLHRGQPGIENLRAAYGSYLPKPGARSGLERAFDRGLAGRPWIPEPERNVRFDAGGVSWELDRFFRNQHLAVELHGGGFHDAQEDLNKDSFKAAKLALMGIRTFAITGTRWEFEPEACLDDLEGLLALGGWRRAA